MIDRRFLCCCRTRTGTPSWRGWCCVQRQLFSSRTESKKSLPGLYKMLKMMIFVLKLCFEHLSGQTWQACQEFGVECAGVSPRGARGARTSCFFGHVAKLQGLRNLTNLLLRPWFPSQNGSEFELEMTLDSRRRTRGIHSSSD